jgi:hypothetical protein
LVVGCDVAHPVHHLAGRRVRGRVHHLGGRMVQVQGRQFGFGAAGEAEGLPTNPPPEFWLIVRGSPTLVPHDLATAAPLTPYSRVRHHAAITANTSPRAW